jgi:hypothetical protein
MSVNQVSWAKKLMSTASGSPARWPSARFHGVAAENYGLGWRPLRTTAGLGAVKD